VPASDDIKLTHGVGSARRALQILLSFTPQEPRHSPIGLSEQFGVPVGSIYRYTSLLRELGMIEDAPDGRLQLTPRILPAARAAMSVQSVVAVAAPFLHPLATQTGETVLLNQLTGDVAVCLFSVPSKHGLRVEHSVGHTMPLGAGATTKMMLALMEPAERTERIAALASRYRPSNAELERLTLRGWAESDGEIDEGAWACAAGLLLEGQPPMTVTVVGPASRLKERRHEISDLVTAAARSIRERWLEGPTLAQVADGALR
jgi:DNA-binding IclR family transcriptional regulator